MYTKSTNKWINLTFDITDTTILYGIKVVWFYSIFSEKICSQITLKIFFNQPIRQFFISYKKENSHLAQKVVPERQL